MKKDKRLMVILVLILLILLVSVGYVLITTTISVDGESTIKNAKWDVHFENLSVNPKSVKATLPAKIRSNNTTTINYGVDLERKGDFYEFYVDVVNDGTLNAKFSSSPFIYGLSDKQEKYIDCHVTYANGTEINQDDKLKKNTRKRIKVNMKYREDVEKKDILYEDMKLDLIFAMKLVQD